MKRKIIKLGTATLVASLPAKWIKEFGLKQGDYLEVEERKGDLVMSTEKSIAKGEEKKIDIKGMNSKMAVSYLSGAYSLGYDKIEVLHDPNIKEYGSNVTRKTTEFMQDTVNKWIGMEIIEQSDNRTILKDLGGVSGNEADNILRRIFLLTKWLTPECVQAVRNRKKDELKEIDIRARNVYKFLYYYRRLLNSKGYKDFNKTAVMYQNTFQIGDIVRMLQLISSETAGFSKSYSPKALHIFDKINSLVEKLDILFFDFDREKANNIYVEREEILKEIRKEKVKATKEDSFLYAILELIILKISNLSNGRFYLEL